MGNTNTLPVVSQTKSLFQLVTGDVKGAAETQEKFFHECPGVAQVTSVLEFAVTLDDAKLEETNKRSLMTVSNTLDGIPLVGQAKGFAHVLAGDDEGAERAFRSSTRSTAVIGGGVGGFLIGGPVGAVAGGIAGGTAIDGVFTGVESHVEGKFTPSGVFAAIENAVENTSAGSIFDAVAVPVSDAVAGYGAGQLTAKIQRGMTDMKLSEALTKRDVAQDALDNGISDGTIKSGQALVEGAKINEMTKTITAYESKLGMGKPVFDPKTGITTSSGSIIQTNSVKCSTIAVTATQKGERTITRTDAIATAGTSHKQLEEMETLERLLSQKNILSSQLERIKHLLPIYCPSNFSKIVFTMLEVMQQQSKMTKENFWRAVTRYVHRCKQARLGRKIENGGEEDEEEEEEDDGNDQIRCLHWNICGMAAQLSTDIGFIPFIKLYNPHIILLNEVKAKDWVVETLSRCLGYRVVYVSSSAPNNRSMRGCAILHRQSKKFFCTPGPGKQTQWINGAPEIEMTWIDIKLRNGMEYRLVSAYVLRDAHFHAASREFQELNCVGKTTVIAGDLNMEKGKFMKLWNAAGFTDLLQPNWVTNITSSHGSETCIDYVMVPTGQQSRVRCSAPIRPEGKNFHLPIPFVIGPNLWA